MSLYQPADGILKTHVTWRDIEEAMQTRFDTMATLGPHKTVQNVGDLKGFMSRICLVTADWQNKDVDEMPDRFIVKISSQLAFSELSKIMFDQGGERAFDDDHLESMSPMTREFHNREVAMYKLLVKENNPKIPITKLYETLSYTTQNQSRGYLITGYVDNLYPVPVFEHISAEDILQPLKAVAALTAMGEKLVESELDFVGKTDFAGELMEVFFKESIMEHIKSMLRQSLPESHREQADRVCNLMSFFCDPRYYRKLCTIPAYLGYRPVLVHSDLWTSNMLFSKRDDKSLELRAIIDWQTVALSNPAQDMCRLLVSSMGGKDRRDNWESLLKKFYGFVQEDMGDLPMPYTFDQLVESYRLYFPISVLFVIPSLGPMMDAMNPQLAEEERLEASEKAKEKAIAMVEDMLTQHEQNIKNHPEFYKID